MKQLDLHGLRLHEAEAIFYEHLNASRLSGKLVEVLFITGVGAIRDLLQKKAGEEDLTSYIPLANRGCIVIEFE